MFIPGIIPTLVILVLVALPYYFFNKYLVKKLRPRESAMRLMIFFTVVLITSLLYSMVAVIIMVRMLHK
jgi:uncharacterized membrane protein